MKIKQSKRELETHLKEQLGFLWRSAESYDAGHITEAKRLAVVIRVLLHETSTSHSLFKQLKINNISFLDSAIPYNKVNRDFLFGLCTTSIKVEDNKQLTGSIRPFLDKEPEGLKRKKKFFAEWWNQTVIVDSKKNKFNRRELVLALANTDGGAHVDPKLNAEYKGLSRDNSMGMGISVNDDFTPIMGYELASVRQIAYEVIKTVEDRFPQYIPNRV